jgi:hypothetical protein
MKPAIILEEPKKFQATAPILVVEDEVLLLMAPDFHLGLVPTLSWPLSCYLIV